MLAELATSWGCTLARIGPLSVHCGCEKASVDTAAILIDQAGGQTKATAELNEVDLGLWEGLTRAELQRRDPKVYKRWCEDPSAVRPPDGEEFAAVQDRIRETLARIIRKGNDAVGAVVLGPLAMTAARCILESSGVIGVLATQGMQPIAYRTVPCEISDDYGFVAMDMEEFFARQSVDGQLATRR